MDGAEKKLQIHPSPSPALATSVKLSHQAGQIWSFQSLPAKDIPDIPCSVWKYQKKADRKVYNMPVSATFAV